MEAVVNIGTNVSVMVGTRKGGFIFSSDQNRENWIPSPLHFMSWKVMHMVLDPRDQRLYAAVVHDVYGASIHYSDDMGKTWIQSKKSPQFEAPPASRRPLSSPEEVRAAIEGDVIPDATQEKINQIWHIKPGRQNEPGVLYAGVEPAALFKSADHGATWELNPGLYNHPHRAEWFPGAGGLGLHTILLDPLNLDRIYVAISTGGCYRTDDGGQTWAPYNKNVRVDFLPERYPEFGQCVHKMAMHPDLPKRIYQQNHCGVYRSEDSAANWIDIGEGKLPSRFGFPIAVHPHDPDTIFVVLEESDEYRLSVDGQFAVWRSQDAGESWQKLTRGLPERSFLVVFREAMALDSLAEVGIYIGTSTGQLFYSRDTGDTWQLLADFLPPILSVETAIF